MNNTNIAKKWETTEWTRWLTNERHISLSVAQEAELKYSLDELIIPVHDTDGTHIFNKYRIAPFLSGSSRPRYRYDKGATVHLYGAHLMKDDEVVFTEGELDALAVRSLGYRTISSTGGATSFQDEWVELLKDKQVIILMDGDAAGVAGSMKIASMLSTARIAWIPTQHGKDATDVIHNGSIDDLRLAIEQARTYTVPDVRTEDVQGALRDLGKELTDEYKEALKIKGKPIVCIKLAMDWVNTELAKRRASHTKPKYKTEYQNYGLAKAKATPIGDIIKVNRYGFAKCVYHNEKTSSMKVYREDNRAYSFCCGKASDAIDIYATYNQCSLSEAIKRMTS